METCKWFAALCQISLLLFAFVSNGHASFLDPGGVGGRGAGMQSLVANPDDVIAALYYNPAGLAKIEGKHIAGGTGLAFLRARYRNSEGYDRMNHMTAPLPFFGYSTDEVGPVVLGIGGFSTLGVGFNYGKDPAHGVLEDIKTSVGLLVLVPSLAYRISPSLSVGFQLNIGYGKSEISQPLRHPQTGIPLGGHLETEGDGFGFGVGIGLLYDFSSEFTLGFSYRSPMKTSLEGEAKFEGIKDDVDLVLYWPQAATLGLAYKPSPKLTLSVALRWMDWSHFDRTNFRFKELDQFDGPLLHDSSDTLRYSFGVEYWWRENIALRAGYEYDEHMIDTRYFSPLIPDVDWSMYSAGIGIVQGHWAIDAFYAVVEYRTRRNSESRIGYPDGKMSGDTPYPGVQISYRF